MSFSLPSLNRCFCGFSIKICMFIIGAVEITRSIIGFLLMLLFLKTTVSTDIATDIADWIDPSLDKLGDTFDPRTETDSLIPLWVIIWIVITVVVLMVIICDMIVSSLLIHGVRKERPGFLIPWMVVTVIFLISIKIIVFYDYTSFQIQYNGWMKAILVITIYTLRLGFLVVVW